MKVIFCAMLTMLTLFHGCGNPDPRYQKIYGWQDRELISCIRDSGTVETETEPELTDIVHALSWMSRNITSVPDKVEYWQTSCETLERRKGDCEDQAILLWRLLREKGFSREANRIGWLAYENSEIEHMIVILHLASGTLIADPTSRYEKLSDFDSYLQSKPYCFLIFEFNLNSIWEY